MSQYTSPQPARWTLALAAATALMTAGCSGGGGSGGTPDPVVTPEPTTPVGISQRPANTACVAADLAPSGSSAFVLSAAYPDLPALSQLVTMAQPPGNPSVWYAVLQSGQIQRFANDSGADDSTTALDLTGQVLTGGEQGLLGLAFHPDFERNRFAYTYYSVANPRRSRISRFEVNASGVFEPASEQVVIDIEQPFGNHNGGHIAFGPDGLLYLGLGDGGSGGDPQNHGQRPTTLLGSMLRLDVDNPSPGMNYGIPPGNPFASGVNAAGQAGAPEVWAWGLRNPYRWSFDRLTGELWAADVGQNAFEEVSIIESGQDYGWNVLEGFNCFRASNCDQTGKTPPVAAYGHSSEAGRSVTGGYVYRGSAVPGLRGRYVFGDFISGRVWAIGRSAGVLTADDAVLATPHSIAGFAEDQAGELYLLNYGGAAGQGIYRLEPADPDAAAGGTVPERLSDTGCVNMDNPRTPAAGTVPYQPSARFWSDGAVKYRAAAMPDGARFTIDDAADFTFPTGSVLIKHFELADSVFETRLYMHHQNGWAGYSYRWNQQRTEAFLLTEALDEMVAGQQWHYPSQSECTQCHTQAAGISLGLEARQLNADYVYPRSQITANQLDTLAHINWPARPFTASDRANSLPQPADTSAPLQARAKAYLHTNCANCHRPGGPTGTTMDLRFTTPLAEMNICDQAPQETTLGSADNRLLAPGAPQRSLISLRMQETGGAQMPPLSVNRVDQDGVALLDQWIESVTTCP